MSRALLMLLWQSRKTEARDVFTAGLQACGLTVQEQLSDPGPGDVLVTWNRMGANHTLAKRFEAAKATVLVVENGYLGAKWRGGTWYAIARNHHNGRGAWPKGAADRWDSWAVAMDPMRTMDGEGVVLAQRGIGEPSLRAPDGWAADMAKRYKARVRKHPGTSTAGPSLEQDLERASVAITWSSGAALRALLMGVHVAYGMQGWIGGPASSPTTGPLDTSDRRLAMFRRLAWAMWERREVESGEALRRVLAC